MLCHADSDFSASFIFYTSSVESFVKRNRFQESLKSISNDVPHKTESKFLQTFADTQHNVASQNNNVIALYNGHFSPFIFQSLNPLNVNLSSLPPQLPHPQNLPSYDLSLQLSIYCSKDETTTSSTVHLSPNNSLLTCSHNHPGNSRNSSQNHNHP